ncbi:MAG: PASTA domain-containing protein [Breznakibacter sp.]
MKGFFKFIFSKLFLKHVGLAVLIGIVLLFAVFFSLGLYTGHGRSREVPNFHGLLESQIANMVEDLDLKYQIFDSVHISNVTPGAVVEQSPKPGSRVKKNRTIFLTINALSPEMILTPRVVDYSLRNAVNILESYGLRVGKLVYVPSEYTNLVVGQMYNGKPIEPGTQIEKGTAIDLMIGKGLGEESTKLPDLLGLTLEEAHGYLNGVSLNMGTVAADETVVSASDSAGAVIWKQSPSPEEAKTMQLGASIDVWITRDSVRIANMGM